MDEARDSISVVMPVRNALPHLDAAIASILGQSHRTFEFVIGDDGSTDGSAERLSEWARRDGRIRLFHGSGEGLGPSGSSNWVVRLARHPIVARMDADDVSGPRRLEAQLGILRADPDAVLVGTLFDCIDAAGATVLPCNRARLAHLGSWSAPFAHGSIMFRRDAFEKAGGYRDACEFWEDMEFYWRMATVGKLLVACEPLFSYRFNQTHS
ncbi:MAG TPA: glycosyltransferase family 2 protein, partial [Sphingomicrobium sp.]